MGGKLRGAGAVPQVGPPDAESSAQVPHGRQGHPDDRRRVALDAFDERAAEAVDGEGARDLQRLAGGDVGGDLGIRDVGDERDGCRGHRGLLAGRPTGLDPDDAVAGVEDAGAPAHLLPAGGRDVGEMGLAEHLAVDLEHGVPADDDTVESGVGSGEGCRDIRRLATREQQHMLVRRQGAALGGFGGGDDGVFVDVRRLQQRLDACLPHQHEAGG